MKLKICGMKYPENIVEVGSILPDYMGFIFWEKSARYFEGSIPELPKSIKKVGVFVDAPVEQILETVQLHDLQVIQLHGHETAAFCESLKKKLPKLMDIIKVFPILNTFDFGELKSFENGCDFFLFDTKGKLPGGNGSSFDWKVLQDYPSNKPFFLSGGIGIEEIDAVKEILKTNLPIHALDVNSKFEIEPGLKKIELLENFKQSLQI